MNSGLHLLFV